MEANYVGPGWYWVEGEEDPLFVKKVFGHYEVRGIDMNELLNYEPKMTAIPRPAQRPVVDWSVMPAWARWVAMDSVGTWCWYTHMPEISDRTFLCNNGIYGTIPRDYAPTYTGDWRNSLVERPE